MNGSVVNMQSTEPKLALKQLLILLFSGRFYQVNLGQLVPPRVPPFPQIDIIGAMVIVWRVRGKVICSVQYCAQELCTVQCTHI